MHVRKQCSADNCNITLSLARKSTAALLHEFIQVLLELVVEARVSTLVGWGELEPLLGCECNFISSCDLRDLPVTEV